MGAFEVQDTAVKVDPMFGEIGGGCQPDPRKVIDECIVAHKVYDSCRRQSCLTVDDIGVATLEAGGAITVPDDAVSVSIDDVKIKTISIDKRGSKFRAGYWDVDVKYDITYDLTFSEADGSTTTEKALSVYRIKTSMFGSMSSDLAIVTDMFQETNQPSLAAAPYAWVEANILGLDAKIVQGVAAKEVQVTLGLFSILKLFRLVHLNVQSKGFCVPEECKGQGKVDPCQYFSSLDFPIGLFTPPQKAEFFTQGS